MINIPKTKNALTTELVFRPYVKLSDNKILYGAKNTKSVHKVALKLYKQSDLDDATMAAVKEVLDICGYEKPSTEIYISVEKLYN